MADRLAHMFVLSGGWPTQQGHREKGDREGEEGERWREANVAIRCCLERRPWAASACPQPCLGRCTSFRASSSPKGCRCVL